MRDTPGYTLILDGQVIETRLSLAALAPRLAHHLMQRAAAENEVVMDASLVAAPDHQDAVLFVHATPGMADTLASEYMRFTNRAFVRGLRFDGEEYNRALGIGLPAQITAADATPSMGNSAFRHQLMDGEEGFLAPSHSDAVGRVHAISTIIIPSRDGAGTQGSPRPASVGETLASYINLFPINNLKP